MKRVEGKAFLRWNYCSTIGYESLSRPERSRLYLQLVQYPMSLCINPDCKQKNLDDQLFCKSCGSEILLLGRYQVVRLLSEKGGFADTYEVMHHGVARVLKVLKDSNPKAIELFQREFEVLNRSDHPGIPKAEEYFEFQPRNQPTALHCLVMEKILGTDLEEYIKQRGTPIDERCAINWLDQIAHILQEIHNQKLLHRDIKPSNIILQPNGQLALIDFGAVGRFDEGATQQPIGTFIFTPGYAAPEQTMGRAVPQSDFFSLGRTMVFLLTGKQIAAMRDGDGEWNWQTRVEHLSPSLVAQIERMMNEGIEQRPASATELIDWVAANQVTTRSRNVGANVGSIESGRSFYPPTIPTDAQASANAGPTAAANATVPQFSTVQTFQTGQTAQTSSTFEAGATTVAQPASRKGVIILGAIAVLGLLAATAFGLTLLWSQSSKKTATVGDSNSGDPSATVATGVCKTKELSRKSGNNLFGVIEVGSKGIKAQAIHELDVANKEGFKYKARDEAIPTQDTSPADAAAQEATVKGVTVTMKDLQERFQIPCEQILIYGSSGLADKAKHKDALTKAIEMATGRQMQFISVEDEAKFVFDGVVPEHRRQQVITVDIGSGNTKGAFLNGKEYQTYGIPFGTADFSKKVDEKRGDKSFIAEAEKQKKESIVPQIRQTTRLTPALANTSRIYLAGGIAWALATLTHPCDKDQSIDTKEERVASFTRLRAEDINTFYINATRDSKTLFQPNLSACTPEQRKRAEKDIARMQKKTFSGNDLIAGAEILRALSEELKFAEKDSIFFARYAIDALPIGYLIQQLEASKK
jgi:serine/threonine protein kinase